MIRMCKRTKMHSRRHRKSTVFVKPSNAKCKRPLTVPASRTLGERWTRYRIVNGTLGSPQVVGRNLLQLMGLRPLQIPHRLNAEEGEVEEVVEEVHREVAGAGAEHLLQPDFPVLPMTLGLPMLFLPPARRPPPRLRNLRQLGLLHDPGLLFCVDTI